MMQHPHKEFVIFQLDIVSLVCVDVGAVSVGHLVLWLWLWLWQLLESKLGNADASACSSAVQLDVEGRQS